jgi:hypothetical protein
LWYRAQKKSLLAIVNYNNNIFIVQATGLNVILLFNAAIYESLKSARVFGLGKPFKPKLMFESKV